MRKWGSYIKERLFHLGSQENKVTQDQRSNASSVGSTRFQEYDIVKRVSRAELLYAMLYSLLDANSTRFRMESLSPRCIEFCLILDQGFRVQFHRAWKSCPTPDHPVSLGSRSFLWSLIRYVLVSSPYKASKVGVGSRQGRRLRSSHLVFRAPKQCILKSSWVAR